MFKRQTRAASHAKRQSGFTLIECMVATSVAGVLAAVGVPSMSSVMARQAVQAELNEFQGAVLRARSEAMHRGEVVTVCGLDRPSSTTEHPHCMASGKDWSAGWVVFVDRGDHGDMDEDEDQLVAVHQASAKAGAVASTLRYLSFQPSGISASAASHFQFRPKGGDAAVANPPDSRMLCISKPGRMRVVSAASC
ncbi:GspH/FimT family pseudopilin [Ideonella azotifigens]|uniref:Type II secretion system protein H n=1 Tax=Ideonella azotifigens TaxID=513160 RepID=A0ABN1K7E8_9BURK|nr:GspH/FimT family pseudopilin [Ideonella azotifigens]MCD2342120.1 GspH/FimT family pseudopilin [Ideonella azotifigens]